MSRVKILAGLFIGHPLDIHQDYDIPSLLLELQRYFQNNATPGEFIYNA
jgi:hypothetical protein